jgi:hypothetical protein
MASISSARALLYCSSTIGRDFGGGRHASSTGSPSNAPAVAALNLIVLRLGLDGSGDLGASAALASKKNRNLPRAHLALTHAAPLYQHLLANAGEYKVSGGES